MDTELDAHRELLGAARAAHLRRDWQASYDGFAHAQEIAPLDPDDLDALSFAAWRLGRCKESIRFAEQVFAELVRAEPEAAATKSVEVALAWLTRGDLNIGQGWMNRARRLLDGAPEAPAHAYLAYLDTWIADLIGDSDTRRQKVAELKAMSGRLDTPVVTTLGLVAEALVAIGEARVKDAFGLIDEAMLPVLADEVPIEWAGDIYCLVLHQCNRLADQPRMRAWTQSMTRWCEDVAASPTYGGLCEMYRLRLQAATDDYRTLEDKLSTASSIVDEINSFAAAEGYYQLGEIRRIRGDLDGALVAFARAREMGADPQPGEALVRFRQGDSDAAWTALQIALGWQDRIGRIRLLRIAVEVALARDCLEEAEMLCHELESGAADFGTPGFRAWAAHARGALLVARQEHSAGLDTLHVALREYRTQQCRYETAQVYELMAQVHAARGEQQTADAKTATAQGIYRQLGVEPVRKASTPSPGGLTRREVDILTRIAGGATNKRVAEQVCLSEKTVRRHLANIYTKLGVSSRTAAVSWAYAHRVVDPPLPADA
jgi:DNA-binding NarL/FixJ family response regulator